MNDQTKKKDAGKPQLHRAPTAMIRGTARVLEYGAKKYGDQSDHWDEVEEIRYIDAAYRHLLAIIDGEDADKESGLPHIWHLACNAGFLCALRERRCKE